MQGLEMARRAGRGSDENFWFVLGKLEGWGGGNDGRGGRGNLLAVVAVRGVAAQGKVKAMVLFLRDLGAAKGQGVGVGCECAGQSAGNMVGLDMHGAAGRETEVGLAPYPEGEGD